jgi:hypothetical protein
VPEYKRKGVVEVDLVMSLGFLCVVHHGPHPVLTHVLLDTWFRCRWSIRNGANGHCGLC